MERFRIETIEKLDGVAEDPSPSTAVPGGSPPNPGDDYPMATFLRLYMLLGGLGLGIWGAIVLVRRACFYWRSRQTTGTIANIRSQNLNRSRGYFFTITFTVAGQDYRCEGIGASRHSRDRLGERVGVRYLPDNPSQAIMAGPLNLWALPCALLLMGSAMSIGATKSL